MATFHGDETAPFFGFSAAAAFFSCMWAGYGTAKSGVGVVLPASLQEWQSGSLVMLVSGLFASNWQDVTNIRQVLDQQVGFLYLRYMADSKTLWNWCEPYITDNEGQELDVKSLRLLGLMH